MKFERVDLLKIKLFIPQCSVLLGSEMPCGKEKGGIDMPFVSQSCDGG